MAGDFIDRPRAVRPFGADEIELVDESFFAHGWQIGWFRSARLS